MRNLKDLVETVPTLTPEDIDRLEQRARSATNGYAFDVNISCYVYGQDVTILLNELRRATRQIARLQGQLATRSSKPETEPDTPIAPTDPEPSATTVPTPVPVTLPPPPLPVSQPTNQTRPQQRNERGGGRR